MNTPTLCLVQLQQTDPSDKPTTIYSLALREGGLWRWYPDPSIALGKRQRVVRWVEIGRIEGWREVEPTKGAMTNA